MNERLKRQLAEEEARLAEKLYELGRTQVMIYADQQGRVWKQTPAGKPGVYFLSLKPSLSGGYATSAALPTNAHGSESEQTHTKQRS